MGSYSQLTIGTYIEALFPTQRKPHSRWGCPKCAKTMPVTSAFCCECGCAGEHRDVFVKQSPDEILNEIIDEDRLVVVEFYNNGVTTLKSNIRYNPHMERLSCYDTFVQEITPMGREEDIRLFNQEHEKDIAAIVALCGEDNVRIKFGFICIYD